MSKRKKLVGEGHILPIICCIFFACVIIYAGIFREKPSINDSAVPVTSRSFAFRDYRMEYDFSNRMPAWTLRRYGEHSDEDFQFFVSEIQDNKRFIPRYSLLSEQDYIENDVRVVSLLGNGINESESNLLLSCPQYPEFYERVWKPLEMESEKLVVKQKISGVIKGPLFLGRGERSSDAQIAIPSHFFYIVYPRSIRVDGKFERQDPEVYLLPHNESIMYEKLDDYKVSLSKIRDLSGIYFPENLADRMFYRPRPL